MLTVYNCVVEDHDLRLVLLAAAVCSISALTAVSLLQHIRKAGGRTRLTWIAIAAAAIGIGIWATHFVAMLAFAPGVPNAYDVPLTIGSLIVAILITGVGIHAATHRDSIDNRLVGGAIVGGGVATMHFLGMAAFDIQGRIEWNQLFVAGALLCGVVFGALSFHVALRRTGMSSRLLGALVLTVAICSLHFTGMAAVSIIPDPNVAVPQSSVPPGWVALGVAGAAFLILLMVVSALWIDLRDFRRMQAEASRMHHLADAAIEGLLVSRGEALVTANASFLALTDWSEQRVASHSLADLFPDPMVRAALQEGSQQIIESALAGAGDDVIPVELLSRYIDYRGAPHLVVAVRDIRERKRAEADIRRLAMNDTLTGLPNRRAFTTHLDAALAKAEAEGGQVALLCLDLDRFKEVNDLFGHAAGDAMLQKVARCISAVLDEGQVLGRLGGDEFAIVAPAIAGRDHIAALSKAILKAFRDENEKAASDGLMSTSIGIAFYPDDARERETLLGHADTALYRSKSEGRDTWRFYEAEMGREARHRRLMEHELRHAVGRNEFRLVYQPQKRLDTGETIGFEALLRWRHPHRGDVSPTVFVPIAEDSGAIIAIGEWVLEAACREATAWDSALPVAVNVSPVQLHSPYFAQTVQRILAKTGLPAARLELEITETALVRDMERAVATLMQIKALGVKVAMDDFGTGYSSLSNLRAFPFDKIKIDGSFIRSVDQNQEAATIVKAVLGIGRGLGLPVLAEGVETSEELEFLAGELCQIGQGYYLGRPGPMTDFKTPSASPELPRAEASAA